MRLKNSVIIGILGMLALIVVYFLAVGLISGVQFAMSQFTMFWYYIVALSLGFGVQLGMFVWLRKATAHQQGGGMPVGKAGKAVAISGTSSTVAMITCCVHYLANIAPLIATAGVITFIAQYQVQFFWIGLAFNVGGIAYVASKIRLFTSHMAIMT